MQSAVLDWYASNARPLAFRRTADPWSVLVSEVIAQQTQASKLQHNEGTLLNHLQKSESLLMYG